MRGVFAALASATLLGGAIAGVALLLMPSGHHFETPQMHRTSERHRIGIRVVRGVGEFFDEKTGERFVARGNNYIRLGELRSALGGETFYHTTFNVGLYRPAQAEAALARMERDGYNVVRVFIDGLCLDGCVGDPESGAISPAYAANLADFLRRARGHRLYVILTTDSAPAVGRYRRILDRADRTQIDGVNVDYLTDEGVEANADFWRDLVSRLVEQGAPVAAILAYELRNEAWIQQDRRPFTLRSGSVTAANGRTYLLADPTDRRRLRDDSLVYWIDSVRAAILSVDRTALVAIGFAASQRGGTTSSAAALARVARERSSADLVDVHAYLDLGVDLRRFAAELGLRRSRRRPVVLGEFGAYMSAYNSPAAAGRALRRWQSLSCREGLVGSLLWTWDTVEQREVWNARSGGWLIERMLAPRNRPDTCAP